MTINLASAISPGADAQPTPPRQTLPRSLLTQCPACPTDDPELHAGPFLHDSPRYDASASATRRRRQRSTPSR